MSGHRMNTKDLTTKCKLTQDVVSTNVLHKKDGPCQPDSVPDLSTIGYLNQFRCEIGYRGSEEIHEKGLSVVDYRLHDHGDTNEGLGAMSGRTTKHSNDPRFNRTLTLDEIKSGLHGLERTGNGYGFTFTSVRLSGRELEDPSLVANFCNLKAIDISDNCIKSIRNLGAMPYLQTINASKNQIETFLDMTPVPVALKEVDFSFNLITSIVNMKKFWSLTDINLSHNELTVIEGFSDLEYLQVLNLSYNKIETIVNLDCPNLLILYLNYNCLKSVSGFLHCNNLRYINLNGNKISTLTGLRYMDELTELQIANNNIEDMSELENLKTILTLTRIRIDCNPISSLENWRLVLIHMLPQILWMDGCSLKAEDLRGAENIFNPSFKKIAFMDHAAMLLDRACQASNHVFDEYCRTRPFPPVLLLVGAPKSHCHHLALLLKERFRNKVYLGGVHSTATTLEGSCPDSDIPVSYESFKEMKNRGEFLATSQILGRVCGFATSQIARAAEKGALLVAAVPLTTAISLRECNLHPKLVLVLPTSPPQFPQDEERQETMKRNSQKPNFTDPDDLGSQKSVEERDEGDEEQINETIDKDPEKDHLVNFAEMLSVVPSANIFGADDSEIDPEDTVEFGIHQHSILKTPHFEMIFDGHSVLDFESDGSTLDMETDNFQKLVKQKPKLRGPKFHGDLGEEVDLEKKRKARYKSLAPGMERYASISVDQDQDDDDDDDDQMHEFDEIEFGVDNPDTDLVTENPNRNNLKVGTFTIVNVSKQPEPKLQTPDEFQGMSSRNINSRPRRMNRLASLLMLDADQRLDSSLNITDILMSLPSMEKVDPKLLQTVNLSESPASKYSPENNPTEMQNGENSLSAESLESRIQPRSTLIPPSFSILQDPPPLRTAPVGNQRFVENYELIVAKEEAKKAKELDASTRGQRVKTSSDDAVETPVQKDKHSNRKTKTEIQADHDANDDEINLEGEEDDQDHLETTLANFDTDDGDEPNKKQHHHKCKDRHHKRDCRTRRSSKNKRVSLALPENEVNEKSEPAHHKCTSSKGKKSGCGKGHHKVKTLIGPSNAFDWRGRKIAKPEEDLLPNFDRDIKRGVFYDGEFSKFAAQKSITSPNPVHESQNPPELKDQGDEELFDGFNEFKGVVGILNQEPGSRDNSNGSDEVGISPSTQPDLYEGLGTRRDEPDSILSKTTKPGKKKGLRFEGSDETEKESNVEIENPIEGNTGNSIETQALGHNLDLPLSPEEESQLQSPPPPSPPLPSPPPPPVEVKKVKEAVKMVESESINTGDREDHHLRQKDAMKSSIMQTREEYAEFNWDNPGFFHTVLDTSDLCRSYESLETLATELLIKYKKESKVKDFLKASVKSHAGVNDVDEKCFLVERMKHFKNCASVWSQGYDSISASNGRERDNDVVTKPCEIFFEKTPCPKGILEPTLPRPGITLKMKRIVELHEKKLRCAKKSC